VTRICQSTPRCVELTSVCLGSDSNPYSSNAQRFSPASTACKHCQEAAHTPKQTDVTARETPEKCELHPEDSIVSLVPPDHVAPFEPPDIPDSITAIIRGLKQPWDDASPIPEPFASRILEKIHSIANGYRFRFKGRAFHVAPDVPPNKLEEVYLALGVPRSDHVIAMLAATALQGWRTGLAVTDQGVYWRLGAFTSGLEIGPFRISYAKISRYIIRWHGSHKCAFIGSPLFQRDMAASFGIGGDIDRVIYEMLQEIQQAVLSGCGLHPGVLLNGIAYSRGAAYHS